VFPTEAGVRPKAEVLPKAVAGSPRVGQMFTSTGVLASSGRSSKDVMRGSGLPLQGPSRPRTRGSRLTPTATVMNKAKLATSTRGRKAPTKA
jgi:hypothetical protein